MTNPTTDNTHVAVFTDYAGNRSFIARSDDLSGYNKGGFAVTPDISEAIRFNGDASTVVQPVGTLAQWISLSRGNPADWRRAPTYTIELEATVNDYS